MPQISVPDFQKAFDLSLGSDFQSSRAYWLGRCSELVYPCTPEEKTADQKAREARAAEKKVRPAWWKLSRQSARTAEFETASSEAIKAVKLVAHTEAVRIERDVRAWGFDRFQYLSGISTQCFVAASDQLIVICFRGTEPNRIWDIYDDLLAIPMRYPTQVTGLVHVGFWTALKQVWRDVDTPPMVWPPDIDRDAGKGFTDYLREFRNVRKPQPVWITGHSLGGALATMATARLLGEGVLRVDDIGGIYTFGQPRVGDDQFAENYQPDERHFRIVHDNDVVTRVPPESLKQAHGLAGMLIDKYSGRSETALQGSRFQYRHVGRVVFLSGAVGIKLDIGKLEFLRWRITARLKALFRSGSLVERLLPGVTDHSMSKYNTVLAADVCRCVLSSKPGRKSISPEGLGKSMPDQSDSSSPPAQEVSPTNGSDRMLAIFSGSGIGLLVGLLVALSVSPTVGMVIGGLASSLALILGLNDRYFTPAKAIRIGTFGFACIVGVLLGTYIRTHELLSPSLEDEFERYTDAKLGFSADEAREILKFTRELVPLPGSSNGSASNSGQGKRGSVLFAAEVKAEDCDELYDTTHDRGLRVVAGNFTSQGGVWKDLAASTAANVGEEHRLATLLMVKSAICLPEPAKIDDRACLSLSRLSPDEKLDKIKDEFNVSGRVFASLSKNLPPAMTSTEQKQALLAIRDVLCKEEKRDE